MIRLALFIGIFSSSNGCIVAAQQQQGSVSKQSSDPFILGPWVPVRVFNSNEALQWGIDFVVSPVSAKDRVVLYAYDVSKVDLEFFRKLNDAIVNARPDLAVISSLPGSGSPLLGTDIGSFCVPVILDPRNEPVVRDFISALGDTQKSVAFLHAVVAVAAMKRGGFEANIVKLSDDSPWSPMIASSIPILGDYKPIKFVAASHSGWDVTKTPGQLMVTLSELEKVVIQR
jgi:hypothetical protein